MVGSASYFAAARCSRVQVERPGSCRVGTVALSDERKDRPLSPKERTKLTANIREATTAAVASSKRN